MTRGATLSIPGPHDNDDTSAILRGAVLEPAHSDRSLTAVEHGITG